MMLMPKIEARLLQDVSLHRFKPEALRSAQGLGWQPGDFPLAETYYAHCLSIPLFPSLTDEEQQYVIDCIREFVTVHLSS